MPQDSAANNHSTNEIGLETRNLIKSGKKSLWKPALMLTVVALLLLAGRLFGVGDYLMNFKSWILNLGPWGYFIFSLSFVLLTVTIVPVSVLTFLSGVFFGTIHGIIISNICATATAAISFFIARYIAHAETARIVEKKPRLKKLYLLSRRHEVMAVVLIRFIPLFPFNLINYGFGISPVSFRTFIFWTWLCMLPGTIIFVAGGEVIIEAIFYGNLPLYSTVLISVTIALAIASVIIVYRLAMNYFNTK